MASPLPAVTDPSYSDVVDNMILKLETKHCNFLYYNCYKGEYMLGAGSHAVHISSINIRSAVRVWKDQVTES